MSGCKNGLGCGCCEASNVADIAAAVVDIFVDMPNMDGGGCVLGVILCPRDPDLAGGGITGVWGPCIC